MLTVEQILAAQKAQVSTLFDLSSKALASVERLNELNLQAARASLSETASHAQAVLGESDRAKRKSACWTELSGISVKVRLATDE